MLARQGAQCSLCLVVVSGRYSEGLIFEVRKAEDLSPKFANKKHKNPGAMPVGERSGRAAPSLYPGGRVEIKGRSC